MVELEAAAIAVPYEPNGRGRLAPVPSGRVFQAGQLVALPDREELHGTHINNRAAANFEEEALLRNRNSPHSPLGCLRNCRKKHTGRRMTELPLAHLEHTRWLRSDFTRDELRFLAWLALVAQVKSCEAGLYANGYVRPFLLFEIARRIDSPIRQDKRGRLRCSQLERLIARLIDAGLIVRIARRVWDDVKKRWKSRASMLKVTRAFWELAGVADERDAYLLDAKEKRSAPVQYTDPSAPPAAADSHLDRITTQLARASSADYGPSGPPPSPERRQRAGRRRRPPPS